MKKLRIGPALTLPLDWIALATVVYGARGSGKTVLGSVMAEEATKAGQRFCAIDLKGDWYGLKSSADGKHDGIPVVIFGGDHEDVPLEEGAGKWLGETVAKLGQSCVLDLEHLSKGKQRRLLADFFESLYEHNREPLLLLMDEAQRYAPQSGRGRGEDPETARCLGAVEDLVKLGRKHGIGPVLFTQRGAGLNKEVSELCDLLVAFRTPGPLDQERIKDWLDANTTKTQRDEVMGKLAGLDTGTAVFASGHPDLRIFGVHDVRMRETFDSSSTPKIGKPRREPKKLAAPDLAELRKKMEAAIARQAADNPTALRRRIAELEKAMQAELARKQREVSAKLPPARQVEVPVFDEIGYRDLKAAMDGALRASVEAFKQGMVQGLTAYRDRCLTTVKSAKSAKYDQAVERSKGAWKNWKKEDIDQEFKAWPKPSANGQPKLYRAGLRRMLIALAQRPQGLSYRQLGVRAGISSKSGTFSDYLSKGRTEGLLEGGKERVTITDAGIAAIGDAYEPLPTGRALLQHWLGQLKRSGVRRMLEVLVDAYPEALTYEEIGEAAAISSQSGTFSDYLSKLRTLELIEGDRNGVRASEELIS